MLIDEKYKLIFTGDDVNPNMWLQMPGAVSLEEWQKGAEIVLSYLKDGYFAWNGHDEGALSLDMANRVYVLVDEIIDKYKKWRQIIWENEDGEECMGWIQNYKLTEFKVPRNK